MKFTYTVPINRPAAAAWQMVSDPERMMRSIPGCEDVQRAAPGPDEALAEGEELYRVSGAASLGPVRLRAAGTARVRRDPARHSMDGKISLSDTRTGAVYGTMALEVRPIDEQRSELRLEADVALAGKIGEFAQPILRHKADQILREFARNLIGASG